MPSAAAMPQYPVHLVDDDASVRLGITRLLRLHGWTVKTYATVAEFEHTDASTEPGCLLLDLRISDGSGLDLLARLERTDSPLAVVLISGYGDVPSTVKAMRLGALDFLTKPIDEDALVEAVRRANENSSVWWQQRREKAGLHARLARLTPRERQVANLVVSGMLNKQVADALGASEKTVKVHRGRVMTKLEIRSVAQLVRLLDRVGERG